MKNLCIVIAVLAFTGTAEAADESDTFLERISSIRLGLGYGSASQLNTSTGSPTGDFPFQRGYAQSSFRGRADGDLFGLKTGLGGRMGFDFVAELGYALEASQTELDDPLGAQQLPGGGLFGHLQVGLPFSFINTDHVAATLGIGTDWGFGGGLQRGRIDMLLSARLHLALNDAMRTQLAFDHVAATAMGDFAEQRFGANVYVHGFYGGFTYTTRASSQTQAGYSNENRFSELGLHIGMKYGGKE